METQLKSFVCTTKGQKVISIFGYTTKGVPGIEITGAGKHAKMIREKIIFLTRTRKLKIPVRRFVVCIDLSDIDEKENITLKNVEFPILLLYWYLAGLIPIKKLDDCICSGEIKTSGDILTKNVPIEVFKILKKELNPIEFKSLKLIELDSYNDKYNIIAPNLLLGHIPSLKFKTNYIESSSATPTNCFIA